MYGIGGSNFHDNSEYTQGEVEKNREFMDLDQHQFQQQQSSGLMRYRSAPSSFFANIGDGSGGGGGEGEGGGCEDYLNHRSSEAEAVLARFMSCNGSGDSFSHDLPAVGERLKNEVVDSLAPQNGYSTGSQMVYRSPPLHALSNHDSIRVMNSMELENPMQVKMSTGNCSNLVRHSSSPAGLFANLTVENGFDVMRDAGNFSLCNGTNGGEANPSTNRLSNHINFSSGPSSCSRLMPKMAEVGTENMGAGSPENRRLGNGDGNNGCYMASFPNDSWDDSTFSHLKRIRESDGKMFSGLNALETQNGDLRTRPPGLTRHFSLPKTSTDMAVEFLQFQDSVPCKIRAKRGFATHPRSIAERVRRTRISERMRKLQELFPNMDKQTNTAEMLDLAVEYIKNLQKEVKTLADTRAKCTCSSKQNQFSSATA